MRESGHDGCGGRRKREWKTVGTMVVVGAKPQAA